MRDLRLKTRNSKLTRAQSITEYTVFITVVVLALLAMQIYFKRGVQGKIRDMINYIGSERYNPNLTTGTSTADRLVITDSSYIDGVSTTQVVLDQINRTSQQVVMPETAL